MCIYTCCCNHCSAVLLSAMLLHKHRLVHHCRHGDFFTAILKTQPAMINDWQSRQWSKFFCLSVYVTMYLNDHQRDAFYSSLGMNTTQFNQHVIIETNNTTARIFPEVSFTLMLWNSVFCCMIAEQFDMIDAMSVPWDRKMQHACRVYCSDICLLADAHWTFAFFICTLVDSNLSR